MKSIFLFFILYKIYQQANEICNQDSTTSKCILQSITLTENFILDVDQFDKNFEIHGDQIVINCVFPCQKIIIQGGQQNNINFILENSTIQAESIVLSYQGKLFIKNSFLSSDNKSQQFLQTLNSCVSKTGYCVIQNDVLLYQAVSEDNSLNAFQQFITNNQIDPLYEFIGYGKQDKRPGAGQIIINITELTMFESKITSSYSGEDYKEDQIIPGTAGYIFIKVNKLNFNYDDKSNNSKLLTKGGCLVVNQQFLQTSSSSGFTYIYAKNIIENDLKNSQKTSLKIEDLQDYIINSVCYTSSSGYLYVANDEYDVLIFNYQQKQQRVLYMQDTIDYISKFKFTKFPSISKIIMQNLKIKIAVISEDILKLNVNQLNNSNLEIDCQNNKYVTFSNIVLNFSQIKILDKFVLVENDVEMFKSFFIVNKILFQDIDLKLESSQIDTIDTDIDEINQYPETEQLMITLQQILDNFEDYNKYNFISIDGKTKQVKLKNSSIINSSMITMNINNLNIDKTSKLNAQFQVKANEILYLNKNCGHQGQNNGGLGFLNFSISNAFCLKNWIVQNNNRLQYYENFKYTISTQPRFIRKEQFISRTPIVKYGGFIYLKGTNLYLEGQINANGSDSISDTKFYQSSSAGGIIEVDFSQYYIQNNDDDKGSTKHFNIKGGKGQLYMGPSGGGKFFFNYQQKLQTILEDEGIKNELKLDFIDQGYESFSPEDVGQLFPNSIFAFFSQYRDIFLGQVFNRHTCEPGYYGVFCELCPVHTFKPTYGFGHCFKCPCEASDIYTDIKTSLEHCQCQKPSLLKDYFLEIFIITGIVITILLYQIQSFKKLQQAVDDKIIFTIDDISNTEHIVELQGFNVPKIPTITYEDQYPFLKNSHEFAYQTNKNFEYKWYEKVAINFLYFFNLVPLFKLCQDYIQSNKIRTYQNLLARLYFPNKDNVNYIVKLYHSANKKYMMILFVNSEKKVQNYQYNIKFPYQITILGKGTFQNQFKIDFGNPFNILLIKTIKRRIKQEHYTKIKQHIPSQLLWEDYDKAHPIDIYFSYLTVLLASLQLRIPSYQIRRRVKKLNQFWTKMNKYFKDYGFQFFIFVKIKVNNKKYFYEFFKLMNQSNKMQSKIKLLFLENQNLYPNLIIECHKIQRKKELSIIFPDLKGIDNYKFQENKNHETKIQITEDKIKVLQKIRRHQEVYVFSCCGNFQRKIRRIYRKLFWRFQTFYNCNQKRMPYYIVKIILFVIVIFFRIYLSKRLKFQEFLFLVLFYPSFVEEINLILICLQIFLNKQRLNKFIIQLSFLSFFKSIFLYSLILIIEWNELQQKADLHYFIPFVLLNSVMYLIISYLNCYHFSFSLFDITYEKVLLIKQIINIYRLNYLNLFCIFQKFNLFFFFLTIYQYQKINSYNFHVQSPLYNRIFIQIKIQFIYFNF